MMRYISNMRTTLAIDDDVMLAARAIAERERRTIGEVASELMRKGLVQTRPQLKMRNGIPLLVRDRPPEVPITLELVNSLRDEEE